MQRGFKSDTIANTTVWRSAVGAILIVIIVALGWSSVPSALTSSRFSKALGSAHCLLEGGCFGTGADGLSYDEYIDDWLVKIGVGSLQRSSDDWPLLESLQTHRNEWSSLLGFESPQEYLILLQNDAERRPNGGFYGSYVRVTLDHGLPTDVIIEDSYIPGFDTPESGIQGPEWMLGYLPSREIDFVGANKIGFTYWDGQHIKQVYEQAYPERTVRGVVFLNTAMFRYLLLDFTQTQRRWQFINASVNLIRGSDSRGKKGLYLTSAQDYLKNNFKKLAVGILRNPETISQNRRINIYLSDTIRSVHKAVDHQGLTTRMEEDMIYVRDSNTSFNKTDLFVERSVLCRDEQGNTFGSQMHSGRIELPKAMEPGVYTCELAYSFELPAEYLQYINDLTDEYEIELTSRERHILGLDQERQTRALIYFPQRFTVRSISGDIYNENSFETPFATAATFGVYLIGSGTSASVTLEIEL